MDIRLARRRHLRLQSTDAEGILWRHLRAARFGGFKFRRQHPCGPYIIDFFCVRRRLAIELDGGQHFEPDHEAYDARRTNYFATRGITTLRFTNDLVFHQIDGVTAVIAAALGLI